MFSFALDKYMEIGFLDLKYMFNFLQHNHTTFQSDSAVQLYMGKSNLLHTITNTWYSEYFLFIYLLFAHFYLLFQRFQF